MKQGYSSPEYVQQVADTGYKHDDSPESDKTMLFLVEFSYVNIVSMVLDNASVALELNWA